jgi:hypothetical protein
MGLIFRLRSAIFSADDAVITLNSGNHANNFPSDRVTRAAKCPISLFRAHFSASQSSCSPEIHLSPRIPPRSAIPRGPKMIFAWNARGKNPLRNTAHPFSPPGTLISGVRARKLARN